MTGEAIAALADNLTSQAVRACDDCAQHTNDICPYHLGFADGADVLAAHIIESQGYART